jgi:hypothetical protein
MNYKLSMWFRTAYSMDVCEKSIYYKLSVWFRTLIA